jgi:hypothetical protein
MATKNKTTKKVPEQQKEPSEIVFAPASSAQSQFLTSETDITFYGGEHCASIQNLSIR